jgi:hypothetical protein
MPRTEEIIGETDRQLGLAHARRSDKEKGTTGTQSVGKTDFTAPEYRADTRNNVILSPNFMCKMGLKVM